MRERHNTASEEDMDDTGTEHIAKSHNTPSVLGGRIPDHIHGCMGGLGDLQLYIKQTRKMISYAVNMLWTFMLCRVMYGYLRGGSSYRDLYGLEPRYLPGVLGRGVLRLA